MARTPRITKLIYKEHLFKDVNPNLFKAYWWRRALRPAMPRRPRNVLSVRTFRRSRRQLDPQQFLGITLRKTKNNVFIAVYTATGHLLAWISRGRAAFKQYKKVNRFLLRAMVIHAIRLIHTSGWGWVISRFTLHGVGRAKKLVDVIRRTPGLIVLKVQIGTQLAHNGCRLPAQRRVKRR